MRGFLVAVCVAAVAFFVIASLTVKAASNIPTSIGDCAVVQVRGESQVCR